MKRIVKLTILAILLGLGSVIAKSPTYMQYFYSVKQVLPEAKQIAVFLTKDKYEADKDALNKAAQRTQLKVKVLLASDMKSIGQGINNMGAVDVLLVSDAEVLNKKASRLFVLSKCKDKKVPIISASEEYSQQGALIGLLKGENGRSKIVLNVKHAPYLASRFTEEFNKKAGIKELIQ